MRNNKIYIIYIYIYIYIYTSKNLSGKYNQTFLHHAKQCSTLALKTALESKIQKLFEASINLISDKIADKIKKKT